MKFTIQREAFLKPLRAVAGVVERKHLHALPILSHVLIEARDQKLFLTTTDHEVELIAESGLVNLDQTGALTLPFRKLMDVCRALPENTPITLVQEENRISLRSGRSRFALSSLPKEEFPALTHIENANTVTLEKKILIELLERTCFAMAEQDVRYYLNGMLLEAKNKQLYAVAADGHRLAIRYIPDILESDLQFRIIIPRKGVLELQRLLTAETEVPDNTVKLIIGQNHLSASTGELKLTTKLLDGRFPDYERIIPEQGNKVVVGQRALLREAFLRAAALLTDKVRGVRLKISAGCLKILATNAEQDEVEEDLELDYAGEELEIGFNVKYLIDCLSALPSERVKFTFSDANSSAKLEGEGETKGVYVIMPMRI